MGEAGSSSSAGRGTARFPLARRLKRRRLIEPLFDRTDPDSQSVQSGSVRILYRFVSEDLFEAPFQVGVAVGRSRGHAPRRNRIKRILRETLRHDQSRLERISRSVGSTFTAMILFQGRHEMANRIRTDLNEALQKLERRYAEVQR